MPATKEFYHDFDLVKVSQIKNARIHNLTTTQRNALASTLDGSHTGLVVYDTDAKNLYTWDGTQFSAPAAAVPGAMIYKGAYNNASTAPLGFDVGYVYVWTGSESTLTWAGQTFSPDAQVQSGDQIIYRGTDTWDIYQADLNQASETVAGYVRLATSAEAIAGTNTTAAVTPATLQSKLTQDMYVKQYFTTVNLTALSPTTITHNLNLVDKNAFSFNSMLGDSQVSVDVDAVDANSLTVTSVINLTNLKVTVQGAKTNV